MVASDPHEALSLLANPPAPISLLLTDVVMPNMSGRELARICHAQYPELRVLYMSGYTNDAVGQHGLLEPGLAFIQKPFAGPVLLQRVRAVLDRRVRLACDSAPRGPAMRGRELLVPAAIMAPARVSEICRFSSLRFLFHAWMTCRDGEISQRVVLVAATRIVVRRVLRGLGTAPLRTYQPLGHDALSRRLSPLGSVLVPAVPGRVAASPGQLHH